MAVKAYGILYCPVEALAPSPLRLGLVAGPSALDTFIRIVGSAQSGGAPCLEPHPLGPASLRELAGFVVLDMP